MENICWRRLAIAPPLLSLAIPQYNKPNSVGVFYNLGLTDSDEEPQRVVLTEPQEHRNNHPLEILRSISYRSDDLDGYLQRLALAVQALLGVDWTAVTLCHAEQNTEQVLASTIDLGADADQVSALHGTLAGTVVTTGCPLVVSDGEHMTTYGEMPDGYHAYLGVPLRSPTGAVLGTICSFQQAPRPFSHADIEVVELFAERAAIALDNYLLYQHQRQLNVHLAETNTRLQSEIQERQITEQRLRVSEARFRKIFNASNDAIFVLDPAADRILEVNPQAERLLGYSRQELLSSVRISTVHPNEMPMLLAFYQSIVTQGQGWTDQLECLTKTGEKRPTEISAAPIEFGDRPCIVALVRDISDRLAAQKETVRALETLAEVGELAAMIVHEVRNPLTTVTMGLHAFQRLDLSPAYQERLTLALDEAHRLRSLLDEILLYAKPQTLQVVKIELNAFIQSLLEPLYTLPIVQSRHIRFTPAETPIWIQADKDKLKQVFTNLMVNACEAIAPGDTVTWLVDSISHSTYISVCLHNGGTVIPPEVIPLLTKPFYTTKSTGTGLGLAIVKRILEAHGGTLRIESSTADGTRVFLKLPKVDPEAALPMV